MLSFGTSFFSTCMTLSDHLEFNANEISPTTVQWCLPLAVIHHSWAPVRAIAFDVQTQNKRRDCDALFCAETEQIYIDCYTNSSSVLVWCTRTQKHNNCRFRKLLSKRNVFPDMQSSTYISSIAMLSHTVNSRLQHRAVEESQIKFGEECRRQKYWRPPHTLFTLT